MKKFILKLGLIVVSSLILLIYGLINILNPILLNISDFPWLIIIILFEKALYETWEICTVIYLIYVIYYFIDRKRIRV